MTKANTTIVAKLGVAFVAVAMLLTMVTPAKAATIEELQAMIAQLTAQLAALQGDDSSSASVAYDFTRSLTVGAEGADVTALQNYLLGEGYSIPAGATGYFGAQTTAAVAAWQADHGVSPAVGYFGPISIAKYNSLMEDSAPATDDEDDADVVELDGEAALSSDTLKNGDDQDNVMEGASNVMLADYEVEFTYGDARISRLDLQLTDSTSGTANTENDPWDVFDSFSIYVDGDKVAEMNSDDEDDWLDEDNGTIRISNLGIVAEEDDEITITIAADIASSVDDAGTSAKADWDLDVIEMRFEDGDGVVTTETITVSAVDFFIDEEGADDDLEISSSSNDPDATIFEVDEDTTSDWYEVHVFEVEAGEDGEDIVVDNMQISATSTDIYNDVVDDIKLVIDGEEYDDVTVTNGASTTAAATINFDLDEDVTIDAGDEVEVSVMVKFAKQSGNYSNGTTFKVTTDSTGWEAEGADDLDNSGGNDDITGSATGAQHTLQTEGLVAELQSITETEEAASYSGDEDTGTYKYTFEVTANGADFYFEEAASTTDYVLYEDGQDQTASSTAVLDIAGADDASTADFVLYEGETATFTLTVKTKDGLSGAVKVDLNSLLYSAADDASMELTHTFIPAKDWVSDSLILN